MPPDGGDASGRRSPRIAWLLAWGPVLTLAIGVPSLLIAFVFAVRDLDGIPLPDPLRWLGAALATTVFLLLVSGSYAALFSTPADRRIAHRSFLRSQLMKYNPLGAVAQPASQAVLTSAGSSSAAASFATVLSKLTTGAGGLLWGPVVGLAVHPMSPVVRVACFAAPVGVAACHPGVLRRIARRLARFGLVVEPVPDGWQIARSVGLAFAGIGWAGIGFLLSAPADGEISGGVAEAAAFAFTWTLGFLALPFPGGVGIREMVATVLVPGGAAPVLVAALIFRVTQIAVEFVLMLSSYAPVLTPVESSTSRR